jgi:hypothetical protein
MTKDYSISVLDDMNIQLQTLANFLPVTLCVFWMRSAGSIGLKVKSKMSITSTEIRNPDVLYVAYQCTKRYVGTVVTIKITESLLKSWQLYKLE